MDYYMTFTNNEKHAYPKRETMNDNDNDNRNNRKCYNKCLFILC